HNLLLSELKIYVADSQRGRIKQIIPQRMVDPVIEKSGELSNANFDQKACHISSFTVCFVAHRFTRFFPRHSHRRF
ncbi:MAG: hypothetical protein M3X11_14375, partial [Acidobacteriota bacterium]|nr:hypothetical protein [Acidobacteriota bacterium]